MLTAKLARDWRSALWRRKIALTSAVLAALSTYGSDSEAAVSACSASSPGGPPDTCTVVSILGCTTGAPFWTPDSYAFAYAFYSGPGDQDSWAPTLAQACVQAAKILSYSAPGTVTEFLSDTEGCKSIPPPTSTLPVTRRTGYWVCHPDGTLPLPPFGARKTVVIDPGHGLGCAERNQAPGAVGVTPPVLREDDLTMAISAAIVGALPSSRYTVVLTKTNVSECPTLLERGRIANNANANVFISVHINAPSSFANLDLGTSVLYFPNRVAVKPLADRMASTVSSSLGTNNRGSMARTDLAVLKPTVTFMPAVILEVARLSGSDEQLLRSSTMPSRAAEGVRQAVEWYLAN